MSISRFIFSVSALALAQAMAPLAVAGETFRPDPQWQSSSGGRGEGRGGSSPQRGFPQSSSAATQRGFPSGPQSSSRGPQANTRYDQDDARQALLSGKIMPLTSILALAEKKVSGPVMSVELETHDGKLIYRIVILSRDGRKVMLEMDARNGDVLRSSGN